MTRKPKVRLEVDITPSVKALDAFNSQKPSLIRGGFLRVRGATVGDPLHEFDIPVSLFEAHPDRYTVIDPVPVAASRPTKTVVGTVVPDLTIDAPSEGESEGENYGI